MKRITALVWLWLAVCAAVALGQTLGSTADRIKAASVAPSGACAPANAIRVTNGTLYTCVSGTWTAISGSSGLGDPGSNGILSRTALNTTIARTITAGTGITVTNGTGVSGNPTITAQVSGSGTTNYATYWSATGVLAAWTDSSNGVYNLLGQYPYMTNVVSDASSNGWTFLKQRGGTLLGSGASVPITGDNLGYLTFSGYSTANGEKVGGTLVMRATETWASGAAGTEAYLEVTRTGTTGGKNGYLFDGNASNPGIRFYREGVAKGGIRFLDSGSKMQFSNDYTTWTDMGAGGGDALTANPLSQFASTTSAQLAGVLSNETGSGLAMFNSNPVLSAGLYFNGTTSGDVLLKRSGIGVQVRLGDDSDYGYLIADNLTAVESFSGGVSSPTSIGSNQNDYAPGASAIHRLTSSGAVNITGLDVAQADGDLGFIANIGSNTITLKHQDASSTAANRFLSVTSADVALAANEIALRIYDNTTSRWRIAKLGASGGGSPGGSGTELQFRGGASTFSAVTGSSSANGGIALVSQSASQIAGMFTGAASATQPVLVAKLGVTPGAGGDAFQVQSSAGTVVARIAATGELRVPVGSLSAAAIDFGTATTGINGTSSSVSFTYSGVNRVLWDYANNAQRFDSAAQLTWSTTSGDPGASASAGITRAAAAVIRVTNGSTGAGGLVIGASTATGSANTLTVQRDSLGTTATDGLVLSNATAAAAGVQQFSPRLRLRGNGWKTNATAASQSVDWTFDVRPEQGAANPDPVANFSYSLNGAAETRYLEFRQGEAVFYNQGANASIRITPDNSYTNWRFLIGHDNFSGYFEMRDNANTTRTIVRTDGDSYFNAPTGNLILGGTAAGSSAAKVFALYNGTAPTGGITDGVQLYAQDVSSSSELHVRDEAGNITTLSPHNFSLIPGGRSEPMAWAFYSERDGVAINVDMVRVIRALEKLTGEQYIYIQKIAQDKAKNNLK